MDPVTHGAVARMAAAIGRSPLPRASGVLAIVGGLAPDLDAVFMPVGWDVYLRVHETGTHSALGGTLLAAVLAGLATITSRASFLPLFITAWIAVSSHIALDVVSGATVRLGWPILDGRTSVGLVAMADPWLAVPVGLALAAAFVSRSGVDRVAPWTVAAVAVVLAGKLVSRQIAVRIHDGSAGDTVVERHVHAQWGSFTRWWIYERTAERLWLSSVDAGAGTSERLLDRPRAPSDLAHPDARLDTVRNFLLAHDMPVRVLTTSGATTSVFWSDLRFCFLPDASTGPQPGSRLRPAEDPIACGVWFGGEIDEHGRIVRQFITLGEYLQER